MNLLTDPVFRVETPHGLEPMSLPALLAALGQDRVESLPGLQRHQEDAFHIFLCYLAGAVLAREDRDDPRQDEAFWRDSIRRLTGRDDDCAWTLVVEDVTRPAFMQAPIGSLKEFEKEFNTRKVTSDQLDLLLTTRNHDLKTSRIASADADSWVYALISLQTMCGYIIKHQGIARMYTGLGSRPCVGLIYNARPGPRWQRDIAKLLNLRAKLLESPWPYRADGIVLTWLLSWDRNSSLALDRLDPFFIEVSRAVRLVCLQGRLVARASIEKKPRIDAKAQNGVLGDPWIPINCSHPKVGTSALTVSTAGLTPELLRNLLFEDGFEAMAIQRPDPGREAQSCTFYVAVLVRGQGTTDGFHEAALHIPSKTARRLFHRGPERDRLAKLSQTGLNDAAQMSARVLKPALLSLLEAGPKQVQFDKREVSAWADKAAREFANAWSSDFFPWLWRTVDHPDQDQARLQWLQSLQEKAWSVFQEAIARYPTRDGRRYRARVRAEGLFYGSLYKTFPQLKEKNDAAKRTG